MPIKQRKNGNYDVRVCRRIGKKAHFWKKTNILSNGEAKRIEKIFRAEADSLKAKHRIGVITWLEALDEYEKVSKERLAVSTQYTQMTTLREYTSCWNALDIRQINRDQIRSHISTALEGKKVATMSNLAKYIRGVFNLQESKGVMQNNPAKGVNFGKEKFRKLTAMSRSQIEAVLQETKRQDSPWYSVYRVSYELGLRSAEAYALLWSSIDFEKSRATIEHSYCSKSKQIKRPKNETLRIVPINAPLKKFLQQLRAENPSAEFVLPRIPAWKHGDAAEILRRFQRPLGIPETNFHSLRASFITHLLNEGAPMTKVQKMVGHADFKTTDRYIRLLGADLDGATDSLAISETDEDSKPEGDD